MKHYKIGFLGAGNVFSKHYNSIKKLEISQLVEFTIKIFQIER